MICHPLRCLYVHVPKTAGTSIKRWLVGYDPHKRWQPAAGETEFLYAHRDLSFLNRRLIAAVGEQEASRYFRFAIVRNPWDRVASAFFYLARGGNQRIGDLRHVAAVHPFRSDFPAFVRDRLASLRLTVPYFRPQIELTHPDDAAGPNLDFIGRFESLPSSIGHIGACLGVPGPTEVPHLRAGDRSSYSELYDAGTRRIVGEIYARDIEQFGYQFGN